MVFYFKRLPSPYAHRIFLKRNIESAIYYYVSLCHLYIHIDCPYSHCKSLMSWNAVDFFFFFKVISVCSVGLEFMTLWSGCILYWQSQPDAHILGVLRLPTYLSCDFCLCLNMHKIPNLEAYKSSLCVSELGTKYALFSCSNNIFFLLFHRKFLRNLLLNRSTLKSSVCKMKADFPTL